MAHRRVTHRARRPAAGLLIAAALVLVPALAVAPRAVAADGRTLHVPGAYPDLAAAIAASEPGDVILLAAGTYEGDSAVPPDKPGITIRGVDRNTVVFDGRNVARNAIEVEADGVALENLTAHSYIENGFYWEGVEGFAGRYLTVWNVGLYAIYAIESRGGVIEDSYASGAADAAFYIGECHPCDTTVRRVTATLSAVGYSGTNAGGNLVIEDSTFHQNGVGILPNSFDVGLEPPPQREAVFRRNVVTDSGQARVPRNTPLGGYTGIGIGIAGGSSNVIEANEVTNSDRYGIAVMTTLDVGGVTWVPEGNRVTNNRVSASGTSDLALAAGAGPGNCFEGNTAGSHEPVELGGTCSADGGGSEAAARDLVQPPPQMEAALPDPPHYDAMPAPPLQPTMPDASGPSADTDRAVGLALMGIALGAAGALVLVVVVILRRRGPVSPSRG